MWNREELIISAALAALPECKRMTPNPGKAAEAARLAAEALADELTPVLAEIQAASEGLAAESAKVLRQRKKK